MSTNGRLAIKALGAITVLTLVAVSVALSPAGPSSPQASPAPASAAASGAAASSPSEADAWAADLKHLDDLVRVKHVSPFTIHTEAEWKAKLAEIGPSSPAPARTSSSSSSQASWGCWTRTPA